MHHLTLIKRPIEAELNRFSEMFEEAMSHADGLLSSALSHILQRSGKRMRPMLTLLMAKGHGEVGPMTLNSAVGLELLHTASLVHDDVVDDSFERRGQPSVNATYDNKVAVLVGDYLLSTALLHVARTGNTSIVEYLAQLGRTLASGEILQLSSIGADDISEETYYKVIRQKTAALFEACCAMGTMSTGATNNQVEAAKSFGTSLGMIFQIKDDIFDYFDSKTIGKPTGNDMAEGKLTLPAIHALTKTNDEAMYAIARKVKKGTVSAQEIAQLVSFTKQNGGIEYAQNRMQALSALCQDYIAAHIADKEIADSLNAYVSFVIERSE